MKITQPTLLIDKEKCLLNIQRIAEKANKANATLRPHFKTHHSAEIGNWFRAFGVDTCTASSVSMAKYFADNGWSDITIAFPYNPLESDEISQLAKRVKLNILLESVEAQQLANELLTEDVTFFIKLDVGTHRTGVDPSNNELISKLVGESTEKVKYAGFIAHAGHTYSSSEDEIKDIFRKTCDTLNSLREKFGGAISYGDTPSCSMMDDFSSFDEIRAGNYVFYDWMQYNIGSCEIKDIGVCLAAPVVAIHKERNEVIAFAGGVHLSKDTIQEDGAKCFGKAVSLTESGWKNEIIGNVKKLSQEHGIIQLPDEQIEKVKIGDLIGILPIHSCLAADLQGYYFSTTGDRIEKMNRQ